MEAKKININKTLILFLYTVSFGYISDTFHELYVRIFADRSPVDTKLILI